MVTIVLSRNCKSVSLDELWNSTQIESPEVNGDNFFCDSWCLSILVPVIFWTKNGKSSNFDEIVYFAQTEQGEFNGDNSFLWFLTPVNIDNCQYWYLLSFRPQFSTKNVKCSSFDKMLHFIEN